MNFLTNFDSEDSDSSSSLQLSKTSVSISHEINTMIINKTSQMYNFADSLENPMKTISDSSFNESLNKQEIPTGA